MRTVLPRSRRLNASRPPHASRLALLESLESRILFSFGVTTGTAPTGQSTYVIDNGGDLVFSVIKGGTPTSTIHIGDITSIKYKTKEMLATYAVSSRYSHYEQGLGSITAVTTTIVNNGNANDWILVTCDDSAETSGAVIQYYAVRRGDNNIYMASLPIDVNNGPGEGRFIAYLDRSVFTAPEVPSDNAPHSASDTVSAIEGSDVYGHTDGQATVQTTSSKFYNMGREMIDNIYHGLTGSASGTTAGAWMYMGNREHSAGGPFFKDIDYQSQTGDIEIYNCIFTGHTQTEAYRQGLHVYSFQFTNGSLPVNPDDSWMEALNLQGWIAAATRGAVTGTASGIPAGHTAVVGLANANAQYWAYVDANGHYTIPAVQPGTYTMTLYDTQLEVGTKTVTITSGQTTSANIVDTFYIPSAASTVFRIGTWDGTPIGFLNTDIYDVATGSRRVEIMHPSDVRMNDWNSTPNFVIGTNTDDQWPAYQFMGVNNSQRITFSLTAAQVQNLTLRVGITWDFSGARPRITVNSGQSYVWTSAIPTASIDLNSRGITRGTWRGVNQLYQFSIPASALRAGTNTIDLPLVSGSYVAGQTWLSPNVSYDAIDLVYTSAATPPTVASVTITPANTTVGTGSTTPFTAVAKDSGGNVLPANFDWSAASGSADPSGTYTAPGTAGTDTLIAISRRTRTPGYTSSSSSTSSYPATATASGTTIVNVVASSLITNNLTATTLSTSQVNLAWTDNSTGEYGFAIERSTDNSLFTQIGTAGVGATSFVATGLSPNTPYYFRVRAYTNTLNGPYANTASATTFAAPTTWYKFNESSGTSAADSSGNNNTATTVNGPTWVAGKSGNALDFNGTNNYATVPAAALANLTNVTISLWVNLDSNAMWSRIFDFGTGTTNYMFLTPQGNTNVVRFAIRTPAVAEQIINGSAALPTGVWTNVAVSIDGSVGTLYVNGAQVGQTTGMSLNPASLGALTQLWLGRSQFSADPYLNGRIDDFRIYNTALSTAQIQALYADAAVGNQAPTIATAPTPPASTALGNLNLAALGADDAGEPPLTYTWSASGPALVAFSANNSNAAKSTTASFTYPGAYTLHLTITDAAGLAVTTDSAVTFSPIAGDANFDGQVDLADYDLWYKHVGTPANGPATGDFNLDGQTDLADYDVWFIHVGTSASLTAATQSSTSASTAAVSITPTASATTITPTATVASPTTTTTSTSLDLFASSPTSAPKPTAALHLNTPTSTTPLAAKPLRRPRLGLLWNLFPW